LTAIATTATAESSEPSVATQSPKRLSPDELATRLSLFLWSSVPDDMLRKKAASGELADAASLRQEVERMLQDPRAERFAEQFVHQWLDMQLLDFLTLVDSHGWKPRDPRSVSKSA
jgi:hypothetical protein